MSEAMSALGEQDLTEIHAPPLTLGERILSLVRDEAESTAIDVEAIETDEETELEVELGLDEIPAVRRIRRDPFNVSFGRQTSGPPEKPVVWPPVRQAATESVAVKPPQRFSPVTGLPMPPEDMPVPVTELEQRQQVEEFRAAEALRTERAAESVDYPQSGYGSSTEREEFSKENGLCEQTDPEAFYPENGGSTREAKKVCLTCSVRSDCLEYALVNGERFGVWGGLSERERRKLKKRLA
jgi:WhiB family redox-sensing transcriptional regulator